VTKLSPKPSFFHYFSDPDTNEEDEEEEDEENEQEDKLKLSVDEDYEVGHSFRTEIIPEAVLWFTGEAIEDEDYDFGDEDDEDYDDEDGDDPNDDEDGPASESEETGLAGNATTGFGAPPGAPGAQPGDCKQN
jgi:nucleosome assembly protein 1-like 1